jgi:hypothetical protein
VSGSSQKSNEFRKLSENERNTLRMPGLKDEETSDGLSNILRGNELDFEVGTHYAVESLNRVWVLLACSARRLPNPAHADDISEYIARTVRGLGWKVSFRRIQPHDSLVANTLAWVVYSTCTHETEAHIHFNGSMGILTYCMSEDCGYQSEILATFGPFIIDCVNAWTTRHGGIPQRCTTFKQRVNYFHELFLVDPAGTWYSSVLEAVNAILGNLMEISLRTIYEAARSEAEEIYVRNGVEEALEYIRAELGDFELQDDLRTIYRSFQGSQTNHTTVEGQLITRIFHRLRYILLLSTILESPGIQFGISSLKVQYLGRTILSFCRIQSIPRDGSTEDYYLMWYNFTHLLLGGMTLTNDEHPDCKTLVSLANRQVCRWVIGELEYIDKSKWANSLKSFWQYRGINDFSRRLNFRTQCPRNNCKWRTQGCEMGVFVLQQHNRLI